MGPPIQIQVPGVCTAVHQPIYSTIQPICPTIIHHPINLHEKIINPGQLNPAPIPVYQRPAELYQDPTQRRGKNHQGVDFNNLILLTKNAMKARRNQSKNPQQASSFILESRQPNLKSENDVLQWLDKGYPKRAREFITVNSLISELSGFESKCDFVRQSETQVEETNSEVTEADNLEDSNVPIMRKRLYRDVLTNSTSTDIILESVLDKRYDELEKQAMEQYRTSEECLALRYQVIPDLYVYGVISVGISHVKYNFYVFALQELERQALEQYRTSDSSVSSSENIRVINSVASVDKSDCDDDGRGECELNDCRENRKRCSGFGKRNSSSPPKDTLVSGREKGFQNEILKILYFKIRFFCTINFLS